MRYVPIIAVQIAPAPGAPPISYSTADFLREQVWSRSEWRASNESMGILLELIEVFEGKPVGAVVALQDRQHEALSRIVVLPGQAREERLRPDLVAPFTRLMLSVTTAPAKAPEGWEELQAAAKPGNGTAHAG